MLKEVGITCFCEQVYLRVHVIVKNVALTLIEWDPNGEKIDHTLLKTIVNFFVENGIDLYEKDFEVTLLQET